MNKSILTTFLAAGMISTSSAVVIFTDSVESPTVTGLSASAIPTNWLQSNQGFGSGNQGLANEDTLAFTTLYGDQALEAHFAQNSGWTTKSGAITSVDGMIEGAIYTLTLNVAAPTSVSTNYGVILLSFNAAQVVRDDVRGNMDANSATILGSKFSGTANTDNMSQQVTIVYTATAADAGRDLAIRVRADQTNPVYFDNFQVDQYIPEPSSALLSCFGTLLVMRRRRA